ncbi:MAG: zinc ABC transporter substrate-binding protein [Treponema sp.]|nr:zinc ABC transporter substrate-binding protein [Treponema sp.]
MKLKGVFASFVLVLCASMACGAKSDSKNKKVTVVASMFPQFDFVRAVAGSNADITMLLKPGAESHSYEPTPKDMKKIQKADLFVYTGGENDVWAETLLNSLGAKAPKTIKLLDIVDAVEEELVEGMTAEEDDDEADGELDEHVWTSPQNAMKITQAICDELCRIDGVNASFYKTNASAYIRQIRNLDMQFASIVKQAKRTVFVFADRFPLRYFADEYGLSYYAAFPGCATDVEASASTIKFLINKVKQEKIPVVFTIEFSNGKIADTVCESTGAKKMEFHSCHNIAASDLKNGETYVSLMTRNIAALKAALN